LRPRLGIYLSGLQAIPRGTISAQDSAPPFTAGILSNFRDLEDEVRIVRVVHGARDLPRIFDS
jgi:hypothetical protein